MYILDVSFFSQRNIGEKTGWTKFSMLQLMKIVIFEWTDNNGRAEQDLLKTPNSLENSLKDFDIN